MTQERRLTLTRILALLFVIGVSVLIYVFRDQAEQLANYGYAGIFFLSILANATIILPAPGIAVVFAMGGVFNPLAVALAAGAGAALGELSGYLAGFSGQVVVENSRRYLLIQGWMQRHRSMSFLVIFGLAAVPNPFFDIAGIAAGTLRLPIWQFIFWCFLGKTVKMLVFAYAGYFSVDYFNLLNS
jgi:membrane protein YqaA with SNARE-associated domain